MDKEIRAQVLEHIISALETASLQGDSDFSHAERLFPNVPESVLLEARVELDYRRTQEWWEAVERSIQSEIIDRALADDSASKESGQAKANALSFRSSGSCELARSNDQTETRSINTSLSQQDDDDIPF